MDRRRYILYTIQNLRWMVCKMRFAIQITETLQRVVEVEANSAEDVEMIVRRRYHSGEPILDASDHVETEIAPVAL